MAGGVTQPVEGAQHAVTDRLGVLTPARGHGLSGEPEQVRLLVLGQVQRP
jgi:hypothetical protein